MFPTMSQTLKTVLHSMAGELSALADSESDIATRLSSLDLGILAERERARAYTLRAAATELLLMIGEEAPTPPGL